MMCTVINWQDENREGGKEKADGFAFFLPESSHALTLGADSPQVRRWLNMFPREQLLFLRSEDFFINTTEVLGHIQEFLAIPRYNFTEKEVRTPYYLFKIISLLMTPPSLPSPFFHFFPLPLPLSVSSSLSR